MFGKLNGDNIDNMDKDIQLIIAGSSSGIGQKLIPILQSRGYEDILGIYNSHRTDLIKEFSLERALYDDEYPGGPAPNPFLTSLKSKICLINLLGISINGSISKITDEQWLKTFNINVNTSFRLVRRLWPYMKQNKYGRIILMGSVVPHTSIFGTSAYSASKSALEGFRHELVSEGIKDNILTFGMDLGYMDAGMTYTIPGNILANLKENIPLKRFGSIEEVANSIEFLINTPYMVGQTLHLNGGLYFG